MKMINPTERPLWRDFLNKNLAKYNLQLNLVFAWSDAIRVISEEKNFLQITLQVDYGH